jgi:hypothetical protein
MNGFAVGGDGSAAVAHECFGRSFTYIGRPLMRLGNIQLVTVGFPKG